MALAPNGHGGSLSDDETRRAWVVSERPATPFFNQEITVPQGLTQLWPNMQERVVPPWLENQRAAAQTLMSRGIIDAFVKTCQRWGLSEKEQLILLGYRDSELFGSELLRGRWLRSSQDVKDRVGYILGISLGLGAIFNEAAEAEVAWIKTPHEKLQGRSPLSFMLDGNMSRLMAVATLIEHERAL